MLITGRILEGNLPYSIIMLLKNVKTGKLELSLVNMKKDALCRPHACSAMDGKKKNIILFSTKLNLVRKKIAMGTWNVLFTIQTQIEGL
jgi:hypothetical protein